MTNIKKGIAYVFFANLINLIISLFTGFVLPKMLSIETYASIKLFQLYVTYIGILHFGFADGMYLYQGGKSIDTINKKEISDELFTFKIFQAVMCIICLIVSVILKNKMLIFCSLIIVPINIASFIRELYQAIGEFKRYSKFTNINTLFIFLINLILIFIIKTDADYIFIMSYMAAYFIYWIIIDIETKKMLGIKKGNINKSYAIRDISSGFFLMIGNFCNVIFTSIDRIFVKNLLGTVKFAFYSFAVSVENLMNVFILPISTVMYNYLCNNRKEENVKKLKKIILVFSTCVIASIFPAKFVVDNWLIKYKDSLNVMFILFAAQYVLINIKCIHINLYKAEKMQKRYFTIMITMVVISIILNAVCYKFIWKSSEMIAVATLITTSIWFVIGEINFKKYRLKWKEYIYFCLTIILFLLCSRINNAILGLGAYILIDFVIINILIRDSLKYFIQEGKKFVHHFLVKGGKV